MIAWYGDDLKMSHADREVLKVLIAKIEKRFGDIKPVFGDEHDYLGMNIKFRDDKAFEVHMEEHVLTARNKPGIFNILSCFANAESFIIIITKL